MSGGEHDSAFLDLVGSESVMNDVRRKKAEANVMMLGVVPGEEILAVRAGVLDGTETFGKIGAVLQRLEVRLGEWVVVGYVRPRVGLGYAEIGE